MNQMRTLMMKARRKRKHHQQRSCGVFSSHDYLPHTINNTANCRLTVTCAVMICGVVSSVAFGIQRSIGFVIPCLLVCREGTGLVCVLVL